MPKGVPSSEYEYLLKDANFRRSYDNVTRGNVLTGTVWLPRVGLVQKRFGKSPTQLAKMTQKQATNFSLNLVGALEKQGYGGGYISPLVKPLKNWSEFSGISIQQKIKMQGREDLVRFADERPPTPTK